MIQIQRREQFEHAAAVVIFLRAIRQMRRAH
jgi:hypothetical protein